MKLPFKLMKKPYMRKQKTSMDRIMAGIAMCEYLSKEYPPKQEILDAFEHQKLEYNEETKKTLLAEFPNIELP